MSARRRAVRTLVEVILFDIVISLIVGLVLAFPVMLLLGAFHSEYDNVPAFGWWMTYLIFFVWSLVIEVTQSLTKDRAKAKTS